MAITAKSSGGSPRELIPAGNYIARCYQMLHIGTVEENVLGTIKRLNKVRIGFELPLETKVYDEAKGPQPLVISKEFTLSLHEKASLRIALKSWRGKDFTEKEAEGFDVTAVIGAPCMLNIIHNPAKSDPTKIYEQIASITPLPKVITCPVQVNARQELSYDVFNKDLFNSLPDFLKDKIKSSDEYKLMENPHINNFIDEAGQPVIDQSVNDEDDLPF
jgi:hypothetical protein